MQTSTIRQVFFTLIMATFMVYGMIVYNEALLAGGLTNATFIFALNELPIMLAIAFVLEFFIVGKIAKKIAFKIVKPTDRPFCITLAISSVICIIMCPIMSLCAVLLFGNISFAAWIQTTALNLPVALLWQLCYCGPFVRLMFGLVKTKQPLGDTVPQSASVAQ